MRILLEKCEVGITGTIKKILPCWTTLFDNKDELLEFLEKNKDYLLGDNFMLVIKEVRKYKKGDD